MSYLHFDIEYEQKARDRRGVCGDVFYWERSQFETLMILADGMGHGIKANIAGNFCMSRLKELLHDGFSLRDAFAAVAATMDEAVAKGAPYSVFTIARILANGRTSILTYEMPNPIIISGQISTVLSQHEITVGKSTIYESTCTLAPKDAILITSDGITQAGTGRTSKFGWGSDGLNKFITEYIRRKRSIFNLPAEINREAFELCGRQDDDDTTTALAVCRKGVTVSIMTGPPIDKNADKKVVDEFMSQEGIKIVMGATTAKIVSSALGKEIEVVNQDKAAGGFTPPTSAIEGVDLVTEGALTLNQLYNVIDENRDNFVEYNAVTELYDYLITADRIIIYLGRMQNTANTDISFKQMGILNRDRIIPLLADKLREKGKLVMVEFV